MEYTRKIESIYGTISGGAIAVSNYHSLIVRNTVFFRNLLYNLHNNGVAHGAGIYASNTYHVNVEGCLFLENWSSYYGGGIAIGAYCDHVKIADNSFISNKAIKYVIHPPWLILSGAGGAIHCSDAHNFSPLIYNNHCYSNQSVSGIIYTSNLAALIYNNVVCNNLGPAIYDGHQLSTTRIFNNTIANNLSIFGGISITSRARIYNNIVWGNRSASGALPQQINTSLNGNPILFNNCVQFGEGGEGAIYDNPDFVDPTAITGPVPDFMAKWSLRDGSPCIDAGSTDTTGLYIPEFDIDGNCRIAGYHIDMGAYEYQYVVGVAKVENLSPISTYPNPGRDFFHINGSKPEQVLEVYGLNGRILFETVIDSKGQYIDSSQLPFGQHLIKLTDYQEGNVQWLKWIKQ